MENKSLLQKDLKKQVVSQLEIALIALKDSLGDKKFANRIKKAAKLMTDGIGKEKKEKTSAPQEQKIAKAIITKKATTPKAAVKKKTPVAVKTAKATVVKKKASTTKQ